MHTVEKINFAFMCLFFACYLYQFLYIPVSWRSAKTSGGQAPLHRFAVLIAARNEEAVIGNLIDSSQAASDGGAGASSSEPAEKLKQLQESNPQHMLVPTEYKVPYRWSRSEIITTSAEDFWAAP